MIGYSLIWWWQVRQPNRAASPLRLRVPPAWQPPWHGYAGYRGPWLEGYFFAYWCQWEQELIRRGRMRRVYLPVWWTECYHRYGKRPQPCLQAFLDRTLDAQTRYFTVVQNDDGILERVPANVRVFAAGGVGDTPVPLLRDRLIAGEGRRDIWCSFMGFTEGPHDRTGVRGRMRRALEGKDDFHFGRGTLKQFAAVTRRSVFTLCPRGWGRTSFRLYEAINLGSIPVYIWDDAEWLPYTDVLDWDTFAVRINVRDIERLPDVLRSHTPQMIEAKQRALRQYHEKYFTFEGACAQIVRMLEEEGA